jgi:hypothetical protein
MERPVDARESSSWSSCLLVVSAYEPVAAAVSEAVQLAGASMLQAPALADFVELRFVALGPRPTDDDELAAAAAAVADAVLRPTRGAPENYLEAVIVDDRSGDVAELREACAAAFERRAVDAGAHGIAVEATRPAHDGVRSIGAGARVAERLADELEVLCGWLMEQHGISSLRRPIPSEELERWRDASDPQTLAERSAASAPTAGSEEDRRVLASRRPGRTGSRFRWRP